MPQPRARSKSKRAKPAASQRFKTHALNDIPTRLPKFDPTTVFDVGAHVGVTALEFTQAFPDARVYCFEPSSSSYDLLSKAVSKTERAVLSKAALGASRGKGWIKGDGSSPQSQLIREPQPDSRPVPVLDGDTYCSENGIDRIGYLKIRTVGHDLEVLRGFHQMLGKGAIDVIQVEAGIYSEARRPVPLERFRGYLGPLGYEIFGLYSASRNFKGRPVLSRIDVVFISPDVLSANTLSRD